MLAAGRTRPELRVVADQCGCPTNADDLALAVLAVAARPGSGMFHAAGTGSTTWHGFAQAIFAAAATLGWPVPVVHAITTADYPTPARRPADSRLDCSRLLDTFGVRLPDWRESLPRAVAAICAGMVAA
jgi:dTDP-4-dehydrorhamnose reductase